jgi:hypothetical protein
MTLEAQLEFVAEKLPANSPDSWKNFRSVAKECDQFTKDYPQFRDFLFDKENRINLALFVALASKEQNTKGTKADVVAGMDAEKERKKKLALATAVALKIKIKIALALEN